MFSKRTTTLYYLELGYVHIYTAIRTGPRGETTHNNIPNIYIEITEISYLSKMFSLFYWRTHYVIPYNILGLSGQPISNHTRRLTCLSSLWWTTNVHPQITKTKCSICSPQEQIFVIHITGPGFPCQLTTNQPREITASSLPIEQPMFLCSPLVHFCSLLFYKS